MIDNCYRRRHEKTRQENGIQYVIRQNDFELSFNSTTISYLHTITDEFMEGKYHK